MSITAPNVETGRNGNSDIAVQTLAGVVMMREADYRRLLAERDELRERIEHLSESHRRALDYYRGVHKAFFETVKHEVPHVDPDWAPSAMNDSVDLVEFADQLAREAGTGQ